MQDYRVETVRDCAPASHSDFLFRSIIAGVTRLSDQERFHLQLRCNLGLKMGQVLRLDDAVVNESRMAL